MSRKDSEWKNHKYISKYKNDKDKWVYVYDEVEDIKDGLEKKESELAYKKMVKEGKEFLDATRKWLDTTEVGKVIHDLGPHKKGEKNRSMIGKFIESFNSFKIKL